MHAELSSEPIANALEKLFDCADTSSLNQDPPRAMSGKIKAPENGHLGSLNVQREEVDISADSMFIDQVAQAPSRRKELDLVRRVCCRVS